jgi:nucleoid DNA-binding protein
MATSKKSSKKKPEKITGKELMRELGINTAACRECTTKNDVENLINSFLDGIVDAVRDGRTVKIHGFGVFSPKTYAGRTQKSGLPGVKDGVATFGDVKLMKFKLSPMAKAVIGGEARKVREPKAPAAAADPGTAVSKSAATGPTGAPAPDAVVKPSKRAGQSNTLAKPQDSHASPTVAPPADAAPTETVPGERSLVGPATK